MDCNSAWPVDESSRLLMCKCPLHRLPLRRELSEGTEESCICISARVHQQSNRWSHAGCTGKRDQMVCLWRSFDEHARRIESIQSALQQSGRAGPVMPDSEDVEPFIHIHM